MFTHVWFLSSWIPAIKPAFVCLNFAMRTVMPFEILAFQNGITFVTIALVRCKTCGSSRRQGRRGSRHRRQSRCKWRARRSSSRWRGRWSISSSRQTRCRSSRTRRARRSRARGEGDEAAARGEHGEAVASGEGSSSWTVSRDGCDTDVVVDCKLAIRSSQAVRTRRMWIASGRGVEPDEEMSDDKDRCACMCEADNGDAGKAGAMSDASSAGISTSMSYETNADVSWACVVGSTIQPDVFNDAADRSEIGVSAMATSSQGVIDACADVSIISTATAGVGEEAMATFAEAKQHLCEVTS